MNNKYNYFIILIITIIICVCVYKITNNNSEKFSSQFESIEEIKKDCPVGDIVYGFCNNICTYYNKDEKEYCTKQCPPAAKKYLIDSPNNIYTNFLLKYVWKGQNDKVNKQLNDVQKNLIQQTEIAQAMQQLFNPGSKWKEIKEKSSLDQTKNLEKHINDNILNDIEKQKQLNILNKLKESIITNNRAFHYTSDPTFNEIVSIIPSKDSSNNEYSIDDKYNFWIEINIKDSDGNISKRFFKPHNFKCYNKIDELLVENNFIKLNNKKLGYLWKIYDVKPKGTEINSTYNIKQLFRTKFNDIKPNRWYEFIKTTTSDDLTDTNNLEVVAKDSTFISWLKLLISIKLPIKESNTFNLNDKKYIYQLDLNEQKVITDLSNKAGISKFKFDNYIIVNEKYYRPQGNILLSKNDFDTNFTSKVIKNLDLDSYIKFNYNGNELYLKVVPPLILNSDLKEKCNKFGYKNKDEYTPYNSDNIMSKINNINNININEINDVIVENADSVKLDTSQKILDALNSKYPDKNIYNTDSYFNRNQVLSLLSLWTQELNTRVKEEKNRRKIINDNCKYTDADVATWDSSKNIIDMGSGINYGQIKDPRENIQDIDQYYIINSDINTVNNEKNDVNRNCAFNKTDVSNWKKNKKIDLKSGLSYGQIKDPTQNIPDIDQYYTKNKNIKTKLNEINNSCLVNKNKDWGNSIDISSTKYGKIKNLTNNGFLIKTDEKSRTDYLNNKCHIKKEVKDEWGRIGDTAGKYGKIKTLTNDGEYGEIGVDNGKYGLIHEEHGGLYGLINNNDKCQPEQNNKNCRKDSDYISLNKCNTDHLSKKRKKISDANSALAKDIASAETIYKQQLAGMMDDWYKIDDAFCIFNEKKNRYDKCISDHKGGNVLSYSEFKNTDSEYKNNLESQKQKGINDAVRDFTNKYKTGPAKGQSCLPGNPSEYTEPNSCTHLGDNLECKHTKFNKTQAELTGAISSKKDTIKQSIIDKGFNDNIDKYANKYSDSGDQCNPSTNVPKHWRPVSSPCEDSEKSCGIKCADDNCLTGKSCIPKDKTITESQMTFEDSTDITDLTDPTTFNEYKKGYNDAKNTWMGKYDNETTCNPIEYVDPNNWKFQDSDDVCGGNLKCINVKEYLDKINKSSNNLNEDACTKLNRDSCKLMNKKYNDCVNKKVIITCPAGQEPDTSQCNRTNGTTICKACPNCGLNQYRVDTGPTLDSDGKYKYCGTCKNCDNTCTGIQVMTGCNIDGTSICDNPIQCDSNQFREGRTKTTKGRCTPQTNCDSTKYLKGFEKATPTTDGKDGTCENCNNTCTGIQVMTGCNKDGTSICDNPIQCNSNQYRQGRTGTNKGRCVPQTNCGSRAILKGFEKATPTTDGKDGTCENLIECTVNQYRREGTCTPQTKCGHSPSGHKKYLKDFENATMTRNGKDGTCVPRNENEISSLFGKVFSFGMFNGSAEPRIIQFFVDKGITIKKVSSGYEHTLFLTSQGQVYGIGRNTSGQLANGNLTNQSNPVLCSKLNSYWVQDIGTGYESSFFLVNGQRVYGCGQNYTKILGKHTDITYLPNDPYNGKYGSSSAKYFNPVKLNNLGGTIKMFCGYYHCLFLKGDGKLYAIGSDSDGQLGLGVTGTPKTRYVDTLTQVSFFNNKNIKDVSVGKYHTLVLTTNGEVYGFGNNTSGQLGRGSTNGYANGKPQLATILRGYNVSYIHSGTGHSMFITNNNKVYSCGYNGYGQLGIGNFGETTELQHIKSLDNINIKKIVSGENHTLFLSEDGDVYALGANHQGQLGIKTKTGENVFGHSYIHNVSIIGGIVKDIFASWRSSFCITK